MTLLRRGTLYIPNNFPTKVLLCSPINFPVPFDLEWPCFNTNNLWNSLACSPLCVCMYVCMYIYLCIYVSIYIYNKWEVDEHEQWNEEN